jgi:hypothetical protein
MCEKRQEYGGGAWLTVILRDFIMLSDHPGGEKKGGTGMQII